MLIPPRFRLLATVLLTIAVTGCTAVQRANPPSSGPATPEIRRPVPSGAITAPATSDPPAVIGEIPAAQLDAILRDASDRTGADPADIEISRAEAVTWPDGSLGCPEQGQTYTQALIDGFHVVLDAGGETLDYRATAAGSFRVCEESGRPGGS